MISVPFSKLYRPIYWRSFIYFFTIALLLNAGLFTAETASADTSNSMTPSPSQNLGQIPGVLYEWIPWIEDRNPDWNCAQGPEGRVCAWVGKVTFAIGSESTSFELAGRLLKDGNIPLPSHPLFAVSDIKVQEGGRDFNNFILSGENQNKQIKLPKGNYKITGCILYDKPPSDLIVPSEYGLVNITIDESLLAQHGDKIRAYRGNDRIHIERNIQVEVDDSLRIEIFRSLNDGNPLSITTLVQLQVSGNSRTIELGQLLPKNSMISKIGGTLHYSLNSNSELSVQVYQGAHELEILSLIPQPAHEIDLSSINSEILPEEEIWLWHANPSFRGVEISGARSLNPSQVKLPANMTGNTILGVARGSTIKLKEVRRGEESSMKNTLYLGRTIWPRLDKTGFIVNDQITGEMNSGDRLNVLKDFQLGGASLKDKPIPVTVDPKSGEFGVEIRETNLNLSGTSNILVPFTSKATLSSTGWDSTMEQINLQLPLPPSWKIFAIDNVSSAHGTWISLWNSYDVFLLMILAIVTFKIFNAKLAMLFFIFSALAKGEFMNPGVFFTWLLVFFAASTVLNNSSHSILRQAIYGSVFLSLAAFAIQTFSFAKLQFVQFLHPQLQAGTRYRSFFQELAHLIDSNPLIWPIILILAFTSLCFLLWGIKGENWGQRIGRLIVGGIGFVILSVIGFSMAAIPSLFLGGSYTGGTTYQSSAPFMSKSPRTESLMPEEQYADFNSGYQATYNDTRLAKVLSRAPQEQKARDRELQSGLFTPEWNWRMAHASLQGPIDPSHSITLYYISSGVERILCALRAILSLTLLVFSAYLCLPKSIMGKILEKGSLAVIFGSIQIFAILPEAKAEYPPEHILKELETRLEQTLCKEVRCSTLDKLELKLDEGHYILMTTARVLGRSLVSLPGQITDFVPEEVLVDGDRNSFIRISGGYIELLLEEGLHQIEVRGRISGNTTFTIQFPQRPLAFELNSSGWKSETAIKRGEVPNEIRLVREEKAVSTNGSEKLTKLGAEEFPETFIVYRNFLIGEHVEVSGTAYRLGRSEKGASIEVPLHQNEILTSSEWKTQAGNILMSFAPGSTSSSFSSRFANPRDFNLTASSKTGVFEQWEIACEDYVSCEITGIPLTRVPSNNGAIRHRITPFTNETLNLKTKMLDSAPGAFLTITRVVHENTWGENRLKGNLKIHAKATRQAPLKLSMDNPGIEIISVQVGETPDTRKFSAADISLLLDPGEQIVNLDYSRPFDAEKLETVSAVKLNSLAGNISTTINLPIQNNRWLIYFGGGEWGPASIFWSKLLVTILLLFILKYLRAFKINSAALLGFGIGLSMIPTIIQIIPVIALIVFHNERLKTFIEEKIPLLAEKVILTILTCLSLSVLYYIIRIGLLAEPTSLIAGNSSTLSSLKWYHDISSPEGNLFILPTPWIFSLPIIYWRILTHSVAILMVFIGLRWIREWISVLKR